MVKLKKGQKLVCVPCGTEVTISALGVEESTIWCCGSPMKAKATKAVMKSSKKKAARKKTAKKKK